jgi:protein TonB
MRKQSVVYSICVHLALVTLLLVLATFSTYTTNIRHSITSLETAPHLTAPKIRTPLEGGARGGGHMNPLPPERGEIPRVAKLFIPPAPRPKVSPRIVLPSGIADMPQIATDVPIGIPTGVLSTSSPGPGGKGGIGPGGCCGGVGPGPGGDGGDKSGPGGYRGPRLSSLPQLLWKTEPEYSEEARKARFQGSVMLALEIDPQGRPRNIRVVRSLGLGLDERAVEAVAQWKFKPGLLNGRPVSAPVSVEVSFRLL